MRPSLPARQRGTVAVSAAVMLGVAIVLAALAVDLGHLFWVRRDLQRVADLASLSAAAHLADADAIARRIAVANGFDPAAADHGFTVTTGRYDDAARSFSAVGAAASHNAVEVVATASVPYFFFAGARSVGASAVASREPLAGFALGSFVARLDPAATPLLNSLLGGLLGGPVGLDLLSYQALAAASLSLGDLQTALGVGTVEALLDSSLSLAGWLDAGIAALNRRGDLVSVQAASVLTVLRASAGPASLRLGDLIRLGVGDARTAATARVNVLQLVSLGAQVASGSGLVKTTPTLSIPGVATVNLALTLVDPPAIAIGPARQDGAGNWLTRAHSGQLRLRLELQLLGSVGGGVVNLPLYIEAGAADADLTAIECRQPPDDSRVTIQVQPQAVTAYIGHVGDAALQNHAAPVSVAPAALLNLLLVRIDGYARVPLENPAQTLEFAGPYDGANTLATAGSGLGLGGLLNADLELTPVLLGLPLPLGGILGGITSLLGALLGPVIDGLLLDPLLSLLGVRLGGGDATAFSLDCAAPRLVQ